MAEILELVDLDELRKEVRDKYREVARDPSAGYHFHTGRAHAIRLGYPASPLDRLPEEACEAFAGVGNPFFWGGPQPGEKVVDLGSGAREAVMEISAPDPAGVGRTMPPVVTPDGRYYAYSVHRVLSDLYLVHGLS